MENAVQQVKEVFPESSIEVPQERYDYMVEDIKNIITMRVSRAKLEIIQGKWEIGQRISQEFKEGGATEYKTIIERLSGDVETSESELYRCIEFFKKAPAFDKFMEALPEGDSATWTLIKTKYLPDLPIAHIPLIIPSFEMDDKWGIIKWWKQQTERNFTIIIKDKDLKLVVTLAKESREAATPLKELFLEVGMFFITLKGWSKDEMDHNDYARINKSIKTLLIKSKGDKTKVKRAIQWCADQYKDGKISWNMETVIKKWPEVFRNVDPYAKYKR